MYWMSSSSLIILGFIFALGECAFPPSFTYWGANGSSSWATLFPNYCNWTDRQSPIAIKYADASYDSSLYASTANFSSGSSSVKELEISDDGVKVHIDFANNSYQWSGLGTNNTWVLDHVHIHWGSNDTLGSEHTLDGTLYPFEVHVVTYSSAYNSLSAAQSAGNNSLAVLGIFGQVGSSDNSVLADLFSLAGITSTPNADAKKESALIPWNFLPSNVTTGSAGQRFYRYYGSLTTPTCDEIVIWTVFADPIYVSETQLNVLRAMKYYAANNATNNTMVNNFRPVQPLNGRTVSRSFATTTTTAATTTTTTTTATTTTTTTTTTAATTTTTKTTTTTNASVVAVPTSSNTAPVSPIRVGATTTGVVAALTAIGALVPLMLVAPAF